MHLSNVAFRTYEQGDEASICELFEYTYRRPMPFDFWHWRFRANPLGEAISILAWYNDTLVGHYCVSRVDLSVHGQILHSGLGGSLMVHPDYRGGGLFALLNEEIHAHMCQENLSLIWSFPNNNSHRLFVQKIGRANIYEIPFFSLIVTNAQHLPPLSPEVCELQQFSDDFLSLWNRVHKNYPIIARRDATFLRWRYTDNPLEKYGILAYYDNEQLLGYLVYKHYRTAIQIVDLLTIEDDQIGLHLIAHLVELARRKQIIEINLWLNVHRSLHHALERVGFSNRSPVTYFTARLLTPLSKSEGFFYTYRNWYVTMGDSDNF